MEPESAKPWRSLAELADGDVHNDAVRHEPALARRDALNRREFLRLMAAALAMGGAAGCAPPREKIVPYVKAPVEMTAGSPLFFATASTHGGYATGVLVESHMGRPTKIEGNP